MLKTEFRAGSTPPLTRHDWLMLALILLIAAVMRLSDGGALGNFNYDQATLSLLSLDMAAGKGVPLLGIESSAGVPNSPATVYFLALPYLISDNPQFATAFIAAWNVVGVGLLWFIARRYFGERVALVAGLAYALHPFAVAYSRSIWAQDYHTPFILLGLLLALYGFIEGRRWAQIAALPVFVFGLQIHFAAWLLLPLFAWVVWLGRRRVSWVALGLSIALTAVTLAPFLIGLAQGDAAGDGVGAVMERLDDLNLRNKALLYGARLATGLGGPWVGMDFIGVYDVVLAFPAPLTYLWLLVGAAAALGLLVLWARRAWGWAVALTLWVILPVAIFVPNWVGVYPHYFIPSLAGLALLIGVGVVWLMERLPDWRLRAALLVGFGGILLSQGLVYQRYLELGDTANTPLLPTPIYRLLHVREALRPYNDVLISGGVSKTSGNDIWRAMLYNTATCVREVVVASGGVAVLPPGAFAVLTPPGALPPATGDLYRSGSPVFVPLRPDEGEYRIDYFDAAPVWNGAALTPIPPVTFSNGAQLTGYALADGRVTLDWRLTRRGEGSYQYFAHFLDVNGEKIGQRDANFWPGNYWCADDRVITWVDTEIPPDTAILRVGLYTTRPDGGFVNADVLDAAGNPAGLWADIDLRADS